ncbi:MAG: transposase [Kiritimatiellia bacterium]
MARKLRLEYPGAIYHITARGNNRQTIFFDDTDRKYLLRRLSESVESHMVRVYAYCFMSNHFHLVAETPHANLSAFMHAVLTGFAVCFNIKYKRCGHVTQGRYGNKLVAGDDYLLKLSRYVHLNPVKVESVKDKPLRERRKILKAYKWSSYRSYANLHPKPDFLDYAPMLQLVSGTKEKRHENYAKFIDEGLKKEDEEFLTEMQKSPRSIGNDKFREWVDDCYAEMADDMKHSEDASFRRVGRRIEIDRVLKQVCRVLKIQENDLKTRLRDCSMRGIAGIMLCKYAGLSQREVSKVLGLATGATVSYQIASVKKRAEKDAALSRSIGAIERRLDKLLK